jgi:hypothetical protein
MAGTKYKLPDSIMSDEAKSIARVAQPNTLSCFSRQSLYTIMALMGKVSDTYQIETRLDQNKMYL